jgi:hypothetical protein
VARLPKTLPNGKTITASANRNTDANRRVNSQAHAAAHAKANIDVASSSVFAKTDADAETTAAIEEAAFTVTDARTGNPLIQFGPRQDARD